MNEIVCNKSTETSFSGDLVLKKKSLFLCQSYFICFYEITGSDVHKNLFVISLHVLKHDVNGVPYNI